FDRVVIGIQGDYDWTRARGENVNNLFGPALSDRSLVDSVASLTGRVGVAMDRVLLYVRGGGAWERDRYEYFTSATGIAVFSASQPRSGRTVGGGFEYAFADCVSAFGEYNYYDFGTRDISAFGPITTGGITGVRERKSVFRVGLNARWCQRPLVAK